MYYLDSNIFIYSALHDPAKVDEARSSASLLRLLAKGSIQACTSSLTWDEVVWIVRRLSDAETAARQGRAFLDLPNLTLVPVDEPVLSEAQSLMEKYNLSPRDCIHAGTAVKRGALNFISFDIDFDDVKEIRRIAPNAASSGTRA